MPEKFRLNSIQCVIAQRFADMQASVDTNGALRRAFSRQLCKLAMLGHVEQNENTVISSRNQRKDEK
jgi:hypothetical protein